MTTPLNTWISVKDKLPDFDTDHIIDYQLLVCWNSAAVSPLDFDGIYFRDESGYRISEKDFTHWMILSKPTTK